MSDFQHWYYINKNYEEDGPVSSEELKQMARDGDIHPGSYVWTQELEEWVPSSKVSGLYEEKKKEVAEPLAPAPLKKKTGSFNTKSSHDSQPGRNTGRATQPLDRVPSTGQTSIPKIATPAPLHEPKPAAKGTSIKPTGPVPMTAPQDIVPKPLTTTHTITTNAPGSSHQIAQPISSQSPNNIPGPIVPAGPSSIPVAGQSSLPKPIPLPNPLGSPSKPAPIAQQPISASPIPPPGRAAGANSIPAPGAASIPSPGIPSIPAAGQPPAPAPPGSALTPQGLPSIPPVGQSPPAPIPSAVKKHDDNATLRRLPKPMSSE